MTGSKINLIACAVFRPELEMLRERLCLDIHVEYLPMALHEEEPETVLPALQEAVDLADESGAERILLAYVLCNLGIRGLRARRLPLVIPRAHDCLSLFLGGTERYLDVFQEKPGTWFRSAGWVKELRERDISALGSSFEKRMGLDMDIEELRERYGEENARFLEEEMRKYREISGSRYVFLRTGVPDEGAFETEARAEAEGKERPFDTMEGDLGWMERFLKGPWDGPDFLTVPPGGEVVLTGGSDLMNCKE